MAALMVLQSVAKMDKTRVELKADLKADLKECWWAGCLDNWSVVLMAGN